MPEAALDPDWLVPDWNASGVGAFMTTRRGGVGTAPFDSLNLGSRTGDDPAAVAVNRGRVAQAGAVRPVWLQQVHGAGVVRLTAADGADSAPVYEADASITTEPGIACAVLVADCLPCSTRRRTAGRSGRPTPAGGVWRGVCWKRRSRRSARRPIAVPTKS